MIAIDCIIYKGDCGLTIFSQHIAYRSNPFTSAVAELSTTVLFSTTIGAVGLVLASPLADINPLANSNKPDLKIGL